MTLTNITFLNIIKLIIILTLIFINLFLIYLEIKLFKNKDKNLKFKIASPIDANLAKILKNMSGVVIGLATLYSTALTHKQDKNSFKDDKISDLQKDLTKTTKNLNELRIENIILKKKVEYTSLNLDSEVKEIQNILNRIENLNNSKNELLTNKDNTENTLTKIKDLESEENHLGLLIKNSMLKQQNLVKALEDYNDIKKSSFLLGDLFEYFKTFGPMEKVAISLLVLNQVILSCLISIIYIFYGDYLIKKFNLNTRYPKLAKFIELRRKFQSYYLLLSIGWIFISVLGEILFCIIILTS